MAATLLQQSSLGMDVGLISRVQAALLSYAYVVATEPVGTTNHVARAAFANKVVNAPGTYAPQLAALIACVDVAAGTAYASTNPPQASNITDAAIAADVIIGFGLLGGV